MTRPDRASTERKTDRIELRVTPSVKAVIQRACALSGLTPGDITYEGARRILEDHGAIQLSAADAAAFFAALASPPEPSSRLVAALARHSELSGKQ